MIQRMIEDAVRRAMADTPVVLLNGARQTGKTTLVQTCRPTAHLLDYGMGVGERNGVTSTRRTKTSAPSDWI
jgi:hypothetical protein